MYSIIRYEKKYPQPITSSVILSELSVDEQVAQGIAYQLVTSDAVVHSKLPPDTLVIESDKGGWYEKMDGTLISYRFEPGDS